MITTSQGIPVAPSEIRSALKRVDERLDLLHMKPPIGAGGIIQPNLGTWAFVMRWREDDPRRAMIRRGEMAPDADFDYLGEIPVDCPIDQAYSYFVAHVNRHREGDVASLRERVERWNRAAQAQAADATREIAMEALDRLKGVPEVAEALGGGTVVKSSLGGVVREPMSDPAEPRSAAEIVDLYRSAQEIVPAPFETEDEAESDITNFMASLGLSPTPDIVRAVLDRLTETRAIEIRPSKTEADQRRHDFAKRMREAKLRRRQENAH